MGEDYPQPPESKQFSEQLLRIGKQNGRASLLFVRWSCERLDKYDAEKEKRRADARKGWATRRKNLKKLKEAEEE